LNGSNGIIGGRSLVHSDSTYLMAQIIGYTPWQAYQIAIYNEATDQSDYVPFDQSGRQLLDDNAISQCRSDWGLGMPRDCLIITKEMNGVSRFNDESGGMLLHLHARYSPDGQEPPVIGLPADYLSPENAPYEPILTNREFREQTLRSSGSGHHQPPERFCLGVPPAADPLFLQSRPIDHS
jgi:hypothetical protein